MRRAKVNGWRSNWEGQRRQVAAGRGRSAAGFFARLRQDFFCPLRHHLFVRLPQDLFARWGGRGSIAVMRWARGF